MLFEITFSPEKNTRVFSTAVIRDGLIFFWCINVLPPPTPKNEKIEFKTTMAFVIRRQHLFTCFYFYFLADIRRHHGHHAIRPAFPDHRVLLRPGMAQVERSGQVQAGHVNEKRETGRSRTREKKSDKQVKGYKVVMRCRIVSIFLPPPSTLYSKWQRRIISTQYYKCETLFGDR